ncbi:uncharacterized protein PHALS_01441 [Plasmopara halstedii]|uniref:Uncharacterized protein n=1 Tax=Plasmopara halstedii TaxID=4781 RepID=A0A0P1AUK4_PLAHL|nr:uncharacterized protein PHALS_01441 [Plasmopara halstedii]CEG45120.1 hypothetical protein PHALS_01441 [Plasmopara halstedii]|eukprot:XP_024581489.1 hypothetical protein PHALS_01441 [Plasmopara halstedii]
MHYHGGANNENLKQSNIQMLSTLNVRQWPDQRATIMYSSVLFSRATDEMFLAARKRSRVRQQWGVLGLVQLSSQKF